MQHNDKFLQRQDYWRDTAPAAIDRTAVAKVDAHGVLKSGDHHLGCIKHCKCWDKLSLTSVAGFLNHQQKDTCGWADVAQYCTSFPGQRFNEKGNSPTFSSNRRTVNFLLKGVIIADTLEEATQPAATVIFSSSR